MNLLCRFRRHKWRTHHEGERSYEQCARCGHIRNKARWTDITEDMNLPPQSSGQ